VHLCAFAAINKMNTNNNLEFKPVQFDAPTVALMNSMREEIDYLNQRTRVLRRENAELSKENEKLVEKNSGLNSEYADYKSQTEATLAETNSIKMASHQFADRYIDMRSKLNTAYHDNYDLRAKLDAEKVKSADLEEEIAALRAQLKCRA